MITAEQIPDKATTGWMGPLFAASLLTLLILLILAIANRQTDRVLDDSHPGTITFDTIQIPDPGTPDAVAPATADLSRLLPVAAPAILVQIDVRPQPLDLEVDLSQMIHTRYSYSDLARISGHHGRFGLSILSEVDRPVQSVYIPPNVFPTKLTEAGVREGKVTVVIVVDEQGRARVQRVLNSTHPDLVNPVVDSINRAVYSAPTREGRPTKVVITRVVHFAAGGDRGMVREESQP